MKSKHSQKVDLIVVVLLVLLAVALNLLWGHWLTPRGSIGMAIFLIPPIVYLAIRRPKPWAKLVYSAFIFGTLLGFFFELIQQTGRGYDVMSVLLPRVLGVPIDSVLGHMVMVILILTYYEHFINTGSPKSISPRHIKVLLLAMAMVMLVVAAYYLRPGLLHLRYPYAYPATIAILPVFLLIWRKRWMAKQLLQLVPYFLFLFFAIEVVALKDVWWTYPGAHYLGWINFQGMRFPVEELLFWMLFYAPAIVSYYKLFIDAGPVYVHASEVGAIQGQVRAFYEKSAKVKIYRGGSNSTRPFSFQAGKVVDVSRLTHILEINRAEHYIVVEPNVSLDQLVDASLKTGLVPPMIAEFPGITVGGAIQGGSGESSSHKWGGFHDTCLEYEIVLGDGSLVTASRTENSDLFWGMSCAYGSLGVITRVKITLVPATRYVRLKYQRAKSFEEAEQMVTEATKTQVDFVDAIVFSPSLASVMTGTYTNSSDLPRVHFRRPYDDWFYIHAEAKTLAHDEYEEVIPLRDYLFRYDRGGFWVAKYAFTRIPFNRLNRTILAGLFSTRKLYKLLQWSNYAYVVLAQDVCLPRRSVVPFMQYADEHFEIYPLWLCPLKLGDKDLLSPNTLKTHLVINVGIWGAMKPSSKSFVDRNRELEHEVKSLGGRKVLYAHAYYTREEFWDIYDQTAYGRLRKKYHATKIFPDVYEKTRVSDSPRRPSKKRGLVALFKSPFNLS